MPSLKDIRQRIQTVKNTQQITRAMRMVSAAKLRRAQDQIVNMRPYAARLLEVISDVATTHRVKHPLLQPPREAKKILMVVLTSDRGLCGGFNNNACRSTERWLNTHGSQFEKIDFIFIGKKGADYFRRRGANTIDVMLNLARENNFKLAESIAERCMKDFIEGGYDEIRFTYNKFVSAISQVLTVETLLPVDISKTTFTDDGKTPFARDMIFEPEPALMVDSLLKQHFAIQVFRVMSESVAAEHAARMTAMENATKNAKDLITNLTLTYNKLRQASITKELIEICSGAEAVNNG